MFDFGVEIFVDDFWCVLQTNNTLPIVRITLVRIHLLFLVEQVLNHLGPRKINSFGVPIHYFDDVLDHLGGL